MAKISIRIIESNSTENCIVLYDNKTHLFLDFGCKPNKIKNYLIKYNVMSKDIAGCLITHEHIDHIRSMSDASFKYINFYATKETFSEMRENFLDVNQNNVTVNNKWFSIANTEWKFKAISTVHNAINPVSYIIKNKNSKIIYLTDTEYFYNSKLKNANAYIIEANYGANFIDNVHMQSKHLNNNINHLKLEDTEKLIRLYKGNKTKLVIFSHISSTNNKIELIEKIMMSIENKNLKCFSTFKEENIREINFA